MRSRPLVIPIHDSTGAVTGGLWGHTLFRWLHVQLLYIPAVQRGRGTGTALMTSAEAEARDRGCIGAHVSTFSFQAAPFYEKLGYSVFGTLEHYPPGHSLLHFRKLFDTPFTATETAACRDLEQALRRARALAAKGEDEAAKQAYIDVLRLDPTHFAALNELAALANGTLHRSAARTAYEQAVRFHPGNPAGRVNLANLLLEDGDTEAARPHYEAALAIDPDLPEAHQGLARVLAESGDDAAEQHWHKGFSGHAIVTKPHRGTGPGLPLLLLVAARGGNIPTRHWIDDRHFAITVIYTDFHDPTRPLPPHALVVNAIGDADLCGTALTNAGSILTATAAPLINPPERVRATGRATNAARLACIPGVVTPKIATLPRAAILVDDRINFPLLLRAPGFHTGKHFVYIESRAMLKQAIAALPGDELLAIEYLDARGPDGLARKYRVMFIDGVLYPLHLAIATDWKVHYFTAAMAANPTHRDEENRFLTDMPTVLGHRAMTALTAINATLDLDYAGVDFALTSDGSVLVFEANATMVISPPGPEPIWDYRRAAADEALQAARRLVSNRAAVYVPARGWCGSRTESMTCKLT